MEKQLAGEKATDFIKNVMVLGLGTRTTVFHTINKVAIVKIDKLGRMISMNVLLTSAGLENERIRSFFLKMLDKEQRDVKVLFIPVAAISVGAIEVLPKCVEDIISCGIVDENIRVYDLHKFMHYEEVKKYDVIYICGGDSEYLLERINENGFSNVLNEYIRNDGCLIGVSAGSTIAANNLEHNLGWINCRLNVHCDKGSPSGEIDLSVQKEIYLTDKQAIYLSDINKGYIIE
jgi:hypothetical protein